MKLHLSDDLSLPIEAVTQAIVVYGGRGMGKTNFGGVFVEELYAAGRRFSVIDPMGVWWGLQHGRKRGEPGIEVLLLGGIHGDLPIEPTAGHVVADLVADEAISVVIDISRHHSGKAWTKGERIRFVTAYMTRLYERQVEHRRPLMQIIDEAARYAPQTMRSGDTDVAACLGIIETICEEGRNLGIGITFLTQRSARLNKSVAELADMMVAFRVVGPNSVAAVMEWLGEHVPKERHKEYVGELRSLPVGTALVVSPGWLGVEGVVAIRERQTFDSSATPKSGHALAAPGAARKPDLGKYRERMAETIEKAQAEDPRELKRRLNERDRQISQLQKQLERQADAVKTEPVEVPVFREGELERLEQVVARLAETREAIAGDVAATIRDLQDAENRVLEAVRQSRRAPAVAASPPHSAHQHRKPAAPTPAVASGRGVEAQPADDGFQPNKAQQRILDALRWYESIGVNEPSNLQVGAIAMIDVTGGYFGNTVGPMSVAGLVERRTGALRLTAAGRAKSSIPERIATLDDYHEMLRQRVRRARNAKGKTVDILNAVIAAGPREMTVKEIGEAVGIDHTGGYFGNCIGPLGTLGLIERDSGLVRPTEIMFPPALS